MLLTEGSHIALPQVAGIGSLGRSDLSESEIMFRQLPSQ